MIVVTGASGFLGSWVSNYLVCQGLSVQALVRENSNDWRLLKSPLLTVVPTEPANWAELICSIKPRAVISLDWSGVENTHRDNEHLQRDNRNRVLSLAKSAIRAKSNLFLTFGSQAENGKLLDSAPEEVSSKPLTVYGNEKVVLRNELTALFKNSQTRFVWGRIFSTYGPTDNPNWLIPSVINCGIAKKQISTTDGSQIWSYLHSLDFSRAVEVIIKNQNAEGIINLGSTSPIKLSTLFDILESEISTGKIVNRGERGVREDQPTYLVPRMEKLLSLGWKEEVEITEGVRNYISWSKGESHEFKGIALPRNPGLLS